MKTKLMLAVLAIGTSPLLSAPAYAEYDMLMTRSGGACAYFGHSGGKVAVFNNCDYDIEACWTARNGSSGTIPRIRANGQVRETSRPMGERDEMIGFFSPVGSSDSQC